MSTIINSDLPAARRSNILRYVNSAGSATIKQLSSMLSVSEATIRRDLDELSNENMILRIHGGAQSIQERCASFESAYRDKATYMVDEKARIGFHAASYVSDGDTILLDSGTTTLQLAKNLSERKNITVITNDLHIAGTIELDPSSTLIVTGGIRRSGFGVLTGAMVQEFFQGIRVDKSFLSADAVDIEFGVSNATFHEVDQKKALIRSAQKVFLMADHTKFGNVALVRVCDLQEVDLLITDSDLPAKFQKQLDNHGIKYALV